MHSFDRLLTVTEDSGFSLFVVSLKNSPVKTTENANAVDTWKDAKNEALRMLTDRCKVTARELLDFFHQKLPTTILLSFRRRRPSRSKILQKCVVQFFFYRMNFNL